MPPFRFDRRIDQEDEIAKAGDDAARPVDIDARPHLGKAGFEDAGQCLENNGAAEAVADDDQGRGVFSRVVELTPERLECRKELRHIAGADSGRRILSIDE